MRAGAMMGRLGPAVAAGVASRVVSIVLRFFSVPLTISLLTEEQYGLWLIISSLILWFSFSDLGIPAALQNQLVSVLQSRDRRRSEALVAYALKAMLVFAGLLLVGGIALFYGIPWGRVLNLGSRLQVEFTQVFLLCLAAFAIGLPGRLGGAIFSAHGRLSALPLSELVAQLAAFATLVVAVLIQWNSLFALVGCYLIAISVVPITLTTLAFVRLGYPVRTPGAILDADRKALLGKGGFFFLITVGELLILHSDALLVGWIGGASAVPKLMIPLALFVNVLQAQNIFLRPLWPVLSHARAQGDAQKFAGLVRRALVLSLAGSLCFGVAVVLAGDWFVRFWSKGIASLPPIMAIGLAFYVLVACVDNLLAMVLNSAGWIERRFRYTLFFGVSKVAVGWLILTYMGIEPLPLAYGVVMLVTSIPFAVYFTRKAIAETGPPE